MKLKQNIKKQILFNSYIMPFEFSQNLVRLSNSQQQAHIQVINLLQNTVFGKYKSSQALFVMDLNSIQKYLWNFLHQNNVYSIMSGSIFKIIKSVVVSQNPSDFNFSFVLSFFVFEGQREDCASFLFFIMRRELNQSSILASFCRSSFNSSQGGDHT